MTSSAPPLWYVYGIVPASAGFDAPPAGLDGVDVTVEAASDGRFAALVSRLAHPDYQPATLEERSGDVEWLGPRARAHDAVLTWASDRGPVVPLPMFSLFSSLDAVHAMLNDRASQLGDALAHIGASREYALRMYRVDSELLAAVPELSPRIQQLVGDAAAASPGQRYLLERKLEGEKRAEVRALTQQIVDDLVASLSAHARDAVRSPIPRIADAEAARGTMVLNAAFLVAPDGLEPFQRTLTDFATRYESRGFRFDFTGPWPAYHFAGAREEAR